MKELANVLSSKLFFTSDTHFGHFNICRLCNRPFDSRSAMDQGLIERWNAVVPEDGVVVHCGDFMLPHKNDLKEYMHYMSKLNGCIHLCRGNHDRISLSDVEVNEKLGLVQDILKIQVDGVSIIACHFPLLAYPSDYHVFGHIHTLKDGTCHGLDASVPTMLRASQFDVGVDQNDYAPISWNKLHSLLNEKTL